MASSNDTNSSPIPLNANSPVNWQVDIPALSEMLIKIGINGLKSLQMSSVDIHTIGCLMALGEVTPACQDFRNSLVQARKEQRSQHWWLHTLVEYGTGKNFVIDQLLKTRAGENVLALLSAVVSVLEDSAVEVLSLLFDKLKFPWDSIPGQTQLENVRSVCLPLARKLDFKDRLAEMHQWLLYEFQSSAPLFNATDALPDPGTMAELMKTLKDVIIQENEQKRKLVFYGMHGAAWLIVYSWNILGLHVSLVHKDQSVHSLEGTYDSAMVVLCPDLSQPSEVLQPIGRTSDVVVLSSKDTHTTPLSLSWIVSCDDGGVDLCKLGCGWNMDKEDRKEVGDIIYSIACEYIERRIWVGLRTEKHRTYYDNAVDALFQMLQRILRLFGLPEQLRRKTKWRDHFQRVSRTSGKDTVEMNAELSVFKKMIQPLDEREQIERHQDCFHPKSQPVELERCPEFCVNCRLYRLVRYFAYVSSCLAFTDWPQSLKKMPIRDHVFGKDRLSDWAFSYFEKVYKDGGKRSRSVLSVDIYSDDISAEALDRASLATDICDICSGNQHGINLINANSREFLGINSDGVLLIDFRAIETSLKPGPAFIIREGDFSLGEERRLLLTGPSDGINGIVSVRGSSFLKTPIRPWNHFEQAKLSVRASVLKDAIRMYYLFVLQAPVDNSEDCRYVEADVPVVSILPGLRFLRITTPCSHPFSNPISVKKVVQCETVYWQDNSGSLWHFEETLRIPRSRDLKAETPFRYCCYPVLNSPLAQWASLAVSRNTERSGEDDTAFFFQQDTCLECTRDQARALAKYRRGRLRVHILSGGHC